MSKKKEQGISTAKTHLYRIGQLARSYGDILENYRGSFIKTFPGDLTPSQEIEDDDYFYELTLDNFLARLNDQVVALTALAKQNRSA